MDYTMTVPCSNCPFRKEGGIPLTSGRVNEIGGMMLSSQGGTFPCHKTVVSTSDDVDLDDEFYDQSKALHCAGALAFALKNDTMTQMMRIVSRFGGFNPDAIPQSTLDLVWDSLSQWRKACVKAVRKTRSK